MDDAIKEPEEEQEETPFMEVDPREAPHGVDPITGDPLTEKRQRPAFIEEGIVGDNTQGFSPSVPTERQGDMGGGLLPHRKKDREEVAAQFGIPPSLATEWTRATTIRTRLRDSLGGTIDPKTQRPIESPSRANIARSIEELVKINIAQSPEYRNDLAKLETDEEVNEFFQFHRNRVVGFYGIKQGADFSLQSTGRDITPSHHEGRENVASAFVPSWMAGEQQDYDEGGKTRYIPIQDYATELYISSFTGEDFDPTKLSDNELAAVGRLKIKVNDLSFRPYDKAIKADGTVEQIPSEEILETRPGAEVDKYDLIQGTPYEMPLLQAASPKSWERITTEAEKRAGISTGGMKAKSVASGALPFAGFGTLSLTKKQEMFLPILDPGYQGRQQVTGMAGLLAGGYGSFKVFSKLTDKGFKTRNAIAAAAVADGVSGMAYQHAVPGILAHMADKPDSYFLNFAEAAVLSGLIGWGFVGIKKLKGKRAATFSGEMAQLEKATTPEEIAAIRERLVILAEKEAEALPVPLRDDEVVSIISGANPEKRPNFLKRWLTTDRGQDPALMNAKRDMAARVGAEVNIRMTATVKELQRAVKAAGGMDDGMEKALNEVFASGTGAGHLPKEVGEVALKMFERRKELSALISKNLDGQPTLKATIDANSDLYLHRSYMLHDPDGAWKKWADAKGITKPGEKGKDLILNPENPMVRDAMEWQRREYRAMAEEEIREGFIAGNRNILSKVGPDGVLSKDVLDAMVQERVKGTLDDARILGELEKRLSAHGQSPSIGESGVLKKRKLDEVKDASLMALMGRHTDPYVNYTKMIRGMSEALENIKFHNQVFTEGKGKWVFDDAVTGFNVKLPEGPRWGALSGKYTNQNMADVLDAIPRGEVGLAGKALQKWQSLNAAVNWSKVVPSHVSQMRNVAGGAMMNMAAGRFSPKGGGQAIEDLFNSLRGMPKEESTARLVRYQELKLLDDNIDIAFLRESVKDANWSSMQKVIDPSIPDSALNVGERALRKSAGKLSEVYQGVDNTMRIYAFENEMRMLRKAFPEVKAADKFQVGFWPDKGGGTMEEYAARMVRDTYPTYSLVPEAVVGLRKTAMFGNFMSFQAEMLRTSKNIVRQGWREVNSGNPTLKANGIKRLGAFVGVAGSPFVLETATRHLSGVSPEELESARFFMPPWSQRSRVMVWNKSQDSFTYLDIGHTNPYTFFHKPFTAYALSGKMPEQAFKDSFMDMFGPFVDRRILLQHASEAYTGRDEHGRAVDPWEVFKAFEPGGLTSFNRLAEAYGHKNAYNWVTGGKGADPSQVRGRDRKAELINNFLGQRVSKVEITGNNGVLKWKGSAYNGEARLHKAKFRGALTDKVPLPVPVQLEKFKEMQADIFEEQKNLYSYIQAARRWGVDEEKIQASVQKLGKVSAVEYEYIKVGKFMPSKFPLETVRRELNDARPVAYEEMAKIFVDLYEAELSIEPDAQFQKK